MKLKDKIKESFGINQELVENFIRHSMIVSFFNLIEEGITELRNRKITKKFEDLQELIMDEREKLGETEIADEKGEKK